MSKVTAFINKRWTHQANDQWNEYRKRSNNSLYDYDYDILKFIFGISVHQPLCVRNWKRYNPFGVSESDRKEVIPVNAIKHSSITAGHHTTHTIYTLSRLTPTTTEQHPLKSTTEKWEHRAETGIDRMKNHLYIFGLRVLCMSMPQGRWRTRARERMVTFAPMAFT